MKLPKVKLFHFILPGQSRSKTVRYMFPVVFSVLAVFSASVITSTNSSYIKLTPSKTIVMSGEVFTIDVFAYAHVPVNALDVKIDFLPGSIEVIGVDKGQSVLTIWTQEPKIENNTISFGGGTYRRGFIGEHRVATINVKALYNGKTEFTIKEVNLLAGDGKGTPVAVSSDEEMIKQSFVIYDQNTEPGEISAELGLKINADIDGDGEVTLRDISSFMAAWYSGSQVYDFC
jgi:hypothetical protein